MADMQTVMLQTTLVCYDDDMTEQEALHYAAEEQARWAQKNKKLGKMEVRIVGDDVEIKTFEKSPITRMRRITGYMSDISNWNDAKREELKDRVKHI